MTKTVRGPLAFLVGTLVMARTSTALLRSDAEAEVSRALVSFGSGSGRVDCIYRPLSIGTGTVAHVYM